MSSAYAGLYQDALRGIPGYALIGATAKVYDEGTDDLATLYDNAVLISAAVAGDALVNHATTGVPAAPGPGEAGIDTEANLTFYADSDASYDIEVTWGATTFPRFRVTPEPDGRIPAGTYAVPGPGIGAVARAGAVLSGDYDALDDWRTALKAVRAGTANARMVGIGDSTTGGWPTSYIDRAADQWAANRLGTTRHGAILTTNPPLYAESRVILGTGWSNTGVGDYGPADRGVAMGAVGAAGNLDIGPCPDTDRFEIWYFDAGVGSFDWWIDGGAHTTVNVGATATIPSPSVITPAVTAGTHTLHIGNIVGNPVFIPFVEPRLGTSGLYVARAGLGSTTSTMWASADSSFASSILVFHTLQPDLSVIMLTAGDLNTQTPLATYRANIDAMVVLALTYGSVVLGVAPRPTITAYDDFNSYDEYIAELESVRDARGCAMIDFAAHFAGVDSDGYMADTLHPTVGAQADMSLVLAAALMP